MEKKVSINDFINNKQIFEMNWKIAAWQPVIEKFMIEPIQRTEKFMIEPIKKFVYPDCSLSTCGINFDS